MIGDVLGPEVEEVARQVVDAAHKVHATLGPGLLESVYQLCLMYELRKRGLKVENEVQVPVVYDNVKLDAALRLDLLVEDTVVVEVKAVEQMLPVFEAQLLTYLKLTGKRLGFLVNFHVPTFKSGIKRMIR